ncbi:MAG: ferrous iron transporter B, partial [Candidatus Obscuribacterales bacterium]|nr:ferrous iron transporter B [Candidatus Obscuribacterales bacterium]
GEDKLCDTPGVYGIASINDEERIARKLILTADVVINVVSALSLDRDLFLSLQLIDMRFATIVVLNQWDEALSRGVDIDLVRLEEELGVPVLTCVAVEGKGVEEIRNSIERARIGNVSEAVLVKVDALIASGLDPSRALLALEADEVTLGETELSIESERAFVYGARRERVDRIVAHCVVETSKAARFSVRLGRFLLHPIFGAGIAAVICYLIFYQLLGIWIAGDLVELTENKGMKVYYEPNVRRLAASVFPCDITIGGNTFQFPQGVLSRSDLVEGLESAMSKVNPASIQFDFWKYKNNLLSILGNLLVGEYGIVTLTVTYLLGLLLPLVLGFYLGLSLLEDSGYLPRLAVLVDRMMNKVGLNGRAIIPLILGLGCVTMATITTRLLTSNREKLIATALLGVAIPCSAQLGVVSGTLARTGGFFAWTIYGVVVFGILAITGVLLNMILPGKSQGLMIDLPPMRLPRMDNVLKKTWRKSWNFLVEATPMFILAGLVVSVAQMLGVLDWFISALNPIIVHWLSLPDDPRIATTFILGIVRRDFASFGLTEVALSPVQAVTAMIVITLFVPCIATVGVMIKERGPVVATTIWVGSWLSAFIIGGFLARALPLVFAAFGAA